MGWSIRTRRIEALPKLAIAGIVLAVSAVPADAAMVAVLQGLDKITARISTFDAPVDRSVRFGSLVITVRACVKRPPEEPPETAAFVQIEDVKSGEASVGANRIFSGWMFKSSPALSALEHPVYDVGVLDCKDDSTSPGSSKGN
jgi:hypothetical protein